MSIWILHGFLSGISRGSMGGLEDFKNGFYRIFYEDAKGMSVRVLLGLNGIISI